MRAIEINYDDPLVSATVQLASAIRRERQTRTDGSDASIHAGFVQAVDARLEALALLTMLHVTPADYEDQRAAQAADLPPLMRASGTY
jgi:hypothetical protein